MVGWLFLIRGSSGVKSGPSFSLIFCPINFYICIEGLYSALKYIFMTGQSFILLEDYFCRSPYLLRFPHI